MQPPSFDTAASIEIAERWSAHNYHPLPVVVASAEGSWVDDVDGNRYLDMLSAYSALNFGHRHPRLVQAAKDQLDRLTLTSRAFHSDQVGVFCKELAELCGKETVLTMNTGVEAVETAVKLARRWAYQVKGVPTNKAKVIVCADNFHGRTTTVVSFSTDPSSRDGFGPFTPGFEVIPYGDADALQQAIDDYTAAILVEPVQGEAGVIIPPKGYLADVRRICSQNNVLFIADEIQSGLGRTGKTFACDHENVQPDVYVLGKALGGGIMPLSAIVANWEIMSVFTPGSHGSTFGGNPLACAIGREVVAMLTTNEIQERVTYLGQSVTDQLTDARLAPIKQLRQIGLWVGIELHPEQKGARETALELMHRGVLCKDTHEVTVRLAPPLTIEEPDLNWALEQVIVVLGGSLFARR